MSTYLAFLDGEVTLRNADDAHKLVDELERNAYMRDGDGVTCEGKRPGVIHLQYWGETSTDWALVLSRVLNEYASEWDIEAKQELCNPVRIWKSKSGGGKVCGTSLTYYPGFEENFIQQLPDEIVKAFKAKGETPSVRAAEAHWTIDYPLGINGEHNFVCSSCGIHSWLNTEYCPHCGAKMAKGWKLKAEEAKQGSK